MPQFMRQSEYFSLVMLTAPVLFSVLREVFNDQSTATDQFVQPHFGEFRIGSIKMGYIHISPYFPERTDIIT